MKPINPQARELYDASHRAMQTQGVALVTDACLYRLEVGTSHIYRDRSTQHATDLSDAVATKLAAQNVPVKTRLNPFVCAEMDAEYLKGLQQTAQPGGRLSPIDSHPLKSSTSTLSATDEAALLALM
ncbi:MAG TPA: hypothetical protein VFY35_09795, partial [Burkholderiaceae bacterium]|nr:hypothetical protein [Burkholderiaceae bacterium]